MGAAGLKEMFDLPIYACEAEKELLADPEQNLSGALFGKPVSLCADIWLRDGEKISAAGMKFRIFATPGHTPGGCCYYSEEAGILFSGDTLFAGSVGRTDFPGAA